MVRPIIKQEVDGYFVVCANGFARGFLSDRSKGPVKDPPYGMTIPDLERCAALRNSLCSCGGRHRIVRLVQTGTGKEIE